VAGIEPLDAIPQGDTDKEVTESAGELSAPCLHGDGTSGHLPATADPMLARVLELWPTLPRHTQRAVYALYVDAALFSE